MLADKVYNNDNKLGSIYMELEAQLGLYRSPGICMGTTLYCI